jgi:tetratricopeptide (TPR) repeat protein/bacterioferritin-associated ferredoxin
VDRHLSRAALERIFSGRATLLEVETTVPHVFRCGSCRELTVKVIDELRRNSALLVNPSDSRAAILSLLETEERQALDRLRARGWWAEIKGLTDREQLERIRSVAALKTPAMFETVISDAKSLSLVDPHAAEKAALTAQAIAELLPLSRYSQELKSDLQGEAWGLIANCHRLAANWTGSQAALREARHHLKQGSGDPSREARLLSIAASLASDTGNLELAQDLLERAASLYRRSEDAAGLANVAVKEAGTLLANLHFAEALHCAEEALRILSPRDLRLEMLARSIITECLIELRRPAESLRSLFATWPAYQQHSGPRTQLKATYLEARLLDLFGFVRESEKSFREVINGYIDEELYKDAFLTILTFFESLYKRGALDKAAKVCEDASRLLDTPLCHDQMKQVWAELLEQVRSRALTVGRVLQVRLYLLRHWSVPADGLPLAEVSIPLVLEAAAPEPVSLPSQPAPVAPEPPEPPPSLADGGYEAALERYDRQLIAAALEECGGRIRETARLLGISRNTLRAKMGKYGL